MKILIKTDNDTYLCLPTKLSVFDHTGNEVIISVHDVLEAATMVKMTYFEGYAKQPLQRKDISLEMIMITDSSIRTQAQYDQYVRERDADIIEKAANINEEAEGDA